MGICLVSWVTWGGGGWWQSGCPSPVWGDLGLAPLPTPHSLRNRALVTHILTYHRITTLPFWPKIQIFGEGWVSKYWQCQQRDPSSWKLPFLTCWSTGTKITTSCPKIVSAQKSSLKQAGKSISTALDRDCCSLVALTTFSKSFVSMKFVPSGTFGALSKRVLAELHLKLKVKCSTYTLQH